MKRAEFMRAFALASLPPIGSANAMTVHDAANDPRLARQVSVLDHPTFQHAHDALPDIGGTILIPAGFHSSKSVPAFHGLVITKPVAIIGVANGYGCALTFLMQDGDPDKDAILINGPGGCLLQNLYIMRSDGQTQPGQGRGVRWYKKGAKASMAGVTINNVTVWRSPSWSFECVCDGNAENYVSKLVMIECTAYEASSGGSLHLGGAGSNNNFFSRCEFNGPGFGYYFNVNGCLVKQGSDAVGATDTKFTGIAPGDEVFGMGIVVGTTVTAATPTQIKLSNSAVETPGAAGTTQLSFWRKDPPPGIASLQRGHVHLARTSISRFHHCSFQGPGTEPVLSTNFVSNDLELRDCYREKEGSVGPAHSFQINGTSNVLIDGLYHQFHKAPSRLLRTGPSGMLMGRITNAQIVTSDVSSDDVVRLANPTDELVIDNSMEQSSATGVRRGLLVNGPGAVIPTAPRAAGKASVLSLPNGSDEVFFVVGDDPVTSIVALRPKQRVTLVFTGAAQLTDGANLKLTGDFKGGPNRTITLVCDGTNWLETSRSAN